MGDNDPDSISIIDSDDGTRIQPPLKDEIGVEKVEVLGKQTFNAAMLKDTCSICSISLSSIVRVCCVECPIVLCAGCLSIGAEKNGHLRTHSYSVIEPPTLCLNDENWPAFADLNLIQGISLNGFKWESIAEHLGMEKKPEECEARYKSFHLDSQATVDLSMTPQAIEEAKIWIASGSVGASMRDDVEVEWENDAELIMADLFLSPVEEPKVYELKMQVAFDYCDKIIERALRREFARTYGLIKGNCIHVNHKFRNLEEEELFKIIKPIARFCDSREELEELIQILLEEQRILARLSVLSSHKLDGKVSHEQFAEQVNTSRTQLMASTPQPVCSASSRKQKTALATGQKMKGRPPKNLEAPSSFFNPFNPPDNQQFPWRSTSFNSPSATTVSVSPTTTTSNNPTAFSRALASLMTTDNQLDDQSLRTPLAMPDASASPVPGDYLRASDSGTADNSTSNNNHSNSCTTPAPVHSEGQEQKTLLVTRGVDSPWNVNMSQLPAWNKLDVHEQTFCRHVGLPPAYFLKVKDALVEWGCAFGLVTGGRVPGGEFLFGGVFPEGEEQVVLLGATRSGDYVEMYITQVPVASIACQSTTLQTIEQPCSEDLQEGGNRSLSHPIHAAVPPESALWKKDETANNSANISTIDDVSSSDGLVCGLDENADLPKTEKKEGELTAKEVGADIKDERRPEVIQEKSETNPVESHIVEKETNLTEEGEREGQNEGEKLNEQINNSKPQCLVVDSSEALLPPPPPPPPLTSSSGLLPSITNGITDSESEFIEVTQISQAVNDDMDLDTIPKNDQIHG